MERRRKTATTATNIIRLPLAFVRSGIIYTDSGAAGHVSLSSYGWSRTAISVTGAYSLGTNPSGVWPSGGSIDRWNGYPLHCR